MRITTTGSARYDVTVVANPLPPETTDPAPTPPDVVRDESDPDIIIMRDGVLVAFGNSGDGNIESFTTQILSADVYVADIEEWRFDDESAASDYPAEMCFDVTMTAL